MLSQGILSASVPALDAIAAVGLPTGSALHTKAATKTNKSWPCAKTNKTMYQLLTANISYHKFSFGKENENN